MQVQNKLFLKKISEKTFYWKDCTLRPPMSGKIIHRELVEFKKCDILLVDFRKVLAIIATEHLFVRPLTSILGYVEGYWVYDIDMLTKEKELVFVFGEINLPRGYTLKDLFDKLCHSKTNREIMQILPKEQRIKSEFEEYSY
jgi:hypothetical protein